MSPLGDLGAEGEEKKINFSLTPREEILNCD